MAYLIINLENSLNKNEPYVQNLLCMANHWYGLTFLIGY